MKIYILGSGVMGSAIAYGLRNENKVVIVGRDEGKMQKLKNDGFEIEIYGENYDIDGKNIILAFKPYALESMTKILKGKANICISVLARTSLNKLKSTNLARNFAVCMPNIAAKFKASVTPYFSDSNEAGIFEILSQIGKAVKVENESEMTMAGVISGCVPAYLGIVAEALNSAAVMGGVRNFVADELISGVFNSVYEILNSGVGGEELKRMVCSPAGTTIEGIYELEKAGIRGEFMSALRASYQKSIKEI